MTAALSEQKMPEVLGQDWVRMRLAASHGVGKSRVYAKS